MVTRLRAHFLYMFIRHTARVDAQHTRRERHAYKHAIIYMGTCIDSGSRILYDVDTWISGASGNQKKGHFSLALGEGNRTGSFFFIFYLFARNICSPSIVFRLTMSAIKVKKNYEKDITGEILTTTLTILPVHIFF